MSLDAVLLGLLDEPRSGYDLKKQLDGSARHDWAATLTQIYSTLKRLEGLGQVDGAPAPSSRGPKRRLYRRTPSGDRRLRAWLAAGPEEPPRHPTLAKLSQLHRLDDRGRADFLDAMRRSAEQRLARLRAETARLGSPRDLTPSGRSRYLVLAMVERRLTAELAWHEEAVGLFGIGRSDAES